MSSKKEKKRKKPDQNSSNRLKKKDLKIHNHDFPYFISLEEMNLQKKQWKQEDLSDFYSFLKSFKNLTKIQRTQRIINTALPVLAIPSPQLKEIAKGIAKGDFLSFLDLMPHEVFEATMIDTYLINRLKDFQVQKQYIEKLSLRIDNRATVDSLKFCVKGNEKERITYAEELIHSELPFQRRIGIRILFSFVKEATYLETILQFIESLEGEKEYYVNMASAWLLCELLIFHEQRIWDFLQRGRVNDFVMKKTISKARESFRISEVLKEKLKSLKR